MVAAQPSIAPIGHGQTGAMGIPLDRARLSRGVSAGPAGKLMSLALVLLGVALAMAFTFRAAVFAQLGYEVASLTEELAAVENEHRRLKLEIARLTDLERVEREAMRLGLVRPAEVRLVALGPEPPGPSLAEARRARLDARPGMGREVGWFERAGTWLARLIMGGGPADAQIR